MKYTNMGLIRIVRLKAAFVKFANATLLIGANIHAEKYLGITYLLWLQALIHDFIRTIEEHSSSAAFLKDDKKRVDDTGDGPWEVDPRSTGWLAG